MTLEQLKAAKLLLAKIERLETERDEFIRSVDAEDRYFQGLDKATGTALMRMATEYYNYKISELNKEFENI